MSYRQARYNNKPVWSGLINLLDNTIEESHPFSEAREGDFHHSFYFEHPEKLDDDNNVFFYIVKGDDGSTKVNTLWRNAENKDAEEVLSKMLDLSDTTDYDDETDEPISTMLNKNVVSAIKRG